VINARGGAASVLQAEGDNDDVCPRLETICYVGAAALLVIGGLHLDLGEPTVYATTRHAGQRVSEVLPWSEHCVVEDSDVE